MKIIAFTEFCEYFQRITESEGSFGPLIDLELGVRSEGGPWKILPLGPVIWQVLGMSPLTELSLLLNYRYSLHNVNTSTWPNIYIRQIFSPCVWSAYIFIYVSFPTFYGIGD